jgi:DNA-binding beta-propeller fold protein YncE
MSSTRAFAQSLIVVAGVAMSAMPSVAEPALVLEQKIALGAVAGRIDHMAVDLARQRLFVAELGNDSVGVVDLKAGTVIHRIAGLKEPQGVGYMVADDTLYVANAGDGAVHLYRGAELAPAGRIEFGEDADNIRIDDAHDRVWIGYGNGGLVALDAASGQKVLDIPLKGHPESFRLDPPGARIFANVPDAGEIAIVDIAAGKQIAAIATQGMRANFPMALDADQGRFVSVFRSPPQMIAFALADGHRVAGIDVCSDADDVFVDARRRRVYLSCGAGAIDVLGDSGDGYERIAHIATVAGARTSLFVPELDRLYLAVRAAGGEPAAIWVFRPTP